MFPIIIPRSSTSSSRNVLLLLRSLSNQPEGSCLISGSGSDTGAGAGGVGSGSRVSSQAASASPTVWPVSSGTTWSLWSPLLVPGPGSAGRLELSQSELLQLK